MRTMTAKALPIKTFEVQCPHCEEAIAEPASGSLKWYPTEDPTYPPMVRCECGEHVFVPCAVLKANQK
jgi:hypothetical protein